MLVVEPARGRDLDGIDRVASASLKEWGGLAWFRENRLGADDSFVVCRHVESGAVVGFALAKRESPCLGHVLAIAVDTRHRREGIGSALLRRVGRDMAQHGAFRLSLEVDADDGAAQAFYLRHGFHPEGLQPGAYRDGADAVRLACPL